MHLRYVSHAVIDNSRMIQDPITGVLSENHGDLVSPLIASDLIRESTGNKRMG